MRKLETWVRAGDVVSGGSQHQHGVFGGVVVGRVGSGSGWVWVDVPDAAVIAPAWDNETAQPFPGNKTWPDGMGLDSHGNATEGFAAILFSNIYNTNYPLWYPFEDPGVDSKLQSAQRFRFNATYFLPL